MRYLLLLVSGLMIVFVGRAQTDTYTTVRSGAFNDITTWGGEGGRPPESGDCDCKLIINHDISITGMTLTDAHFVLPLATSKLSLNGNNTLKLEGISSFDLQHSGATIQLNHNQYVINLKNTIIFRRSTTSINTTSPATGVIRGPASAHSARMDPFFTNSVLPVKLREFKVAAKDDKVSLSWTTDLEVNSDRFEIERSGDGKSWQYLSSISAAGNISTAQHYSYIDNAPLAGQNYYRLKIIDIDTKYEFSPVKSVNINATGWKISVAPSPATSVLSISVMHPENKEFQLKLISQSGQIVYNRKHNAAAGKISLLVTEFIDGAYFLEVADDSGNRAIKSILIAKRK